MMKHTFLKAALLVCALALLCTSLTACVKDPADTPDTTPTDAPTTPTTMPTHPTVTLVDATDSPMLGIWTVESTKSSITQLNFSENGSVIITTESGVLGATFVLEGDQLTISSSAVTMEGTVVIDGNVVTYTTANDTLTLTKAE